MPNKPANNNHRIRYAPADPEAVAQELQTRCNDFLYPDGCLMEACTREGGCSIYKAVHLLKYYGGAVAPQARLEAKASRPRSFLDAFGFKWWASIFWLTGAAFMFAVASAIVWTAIMWGWKSGMGLIDWFVYWVGQSF